MATIFQKNNIYYLTMTYQSNRLRKSLGTSDYLTAKKLAKEIEPRLLIELASGKSSKPKPIINFKSLVNEFLSYDHGWSSNTKRIYRDSLNKYINEGFPSNKSYRAMIVRCLNRCYKWGSEQGLIDNPKHFSGGNDYEARMRIFSDSELDLILNKIEPYPFQLFVRFAYYTGARQGEIKQLTVDNIKHGYVVGKVGRRQIKITQQAKDVLEQLPELWDYSRGQICKTFKKNMIRLNIADARFHDLRRTFGLNLIKQGLSIFQVSKLLGHKTVTTTEKHYAPLLATDIPDFNL